MLYLQLDFMRENLQNYFLTQAEAYSPCLLGPKLLHSARKNVSLKCSPRGVMGENKCFTPIRTFSASKLNTTTKTSIS